MLPIPTNITSSLTKFTDISCICFDLYGTLFQSAAGEVCLLPQAQVELSTLLHTPLELDFEKERQKHIQIEHERLRALGHKYPEVDIVEVWQNILKGHILPRTNQQIRQLIRVYETLNHPTAEMPNALQTLQELKRLEYQLGIISNAQFYTHDLFPRHLKTTTKELGFTTEVYSYQHLHAKPGLFLFEQFLKNNGIPAHQILYIGNDRLNDIYPAQKLGMKTALFAGDKRSLRLRQDLKLSAQPDAIITNLNQIPHLLDVGSTEPAT